MSALVGLVSAAAVPVAIVLAEVRDLYDLLYAAGAAPAGFLGGVAAVVLARRGRRRRERTLGRAGGRVTGAAGRTFGWLAILTAVAAGIAVATYVVLGRFAE